MTKIKLLIIALLFSLRAPNKKRRGGLVVYPPANWKVESLLSPMAMALLLQVT